MCRSCCAGSYLQGLAVHLLTRLLHIGQHDVLRGLCKGAPRVLLICALAVLGLRVLRAHWGTVRIASREQLTLDMWAHTSTGQRLAAGTLQQRS